MPYTITTTEPGHYCMHCGPGACTTDAHSRVSRRAVATLDEARVAVSEATGFDPGWPRLESGGTIGPLPDGTVIEVGRASYMTLWDALPETDRPAVPDEDDDEGRTAIIDAYNTVQGEVSV